MAKKKLRHKGSMHFFEEEKNSIEETIGVVIAWILVIFIICAIAS